LTEQSSYAFIYGERLDARKRPIFDSRKLESLGSCR